MRKTVVGRNIVRVTSLILEALVTPFLKSCTWRHYRALFETNGKQVNFLYRQINGGREKGAHLQSQN